MQIEKVNETTLTIEEIIAKKEEMINDLLKEKTELNEKINALQNALNESAKILDEKDLIIYRLAIKISQM